ncbi:unnamed protein product [Caenorhabditis angaria]|uniref:Uncharacterized protein n=1 Tax=Caenorhabditis angaria TaxID=860376 RepID=A0A9P1ITZ6_9PELO|nr:unnamed protein product [Caenorhabditis angaria]
MKLIFLLLFFENLDNVFGVTCHCDIATCGEAAECQGQYCFTTWILAGGERDTMGCISTRQELSTSQCVENRKKSVTCICKFLFQANFQKPIQFFSCDTEYCNSDDFAIPTDATFYTPPTVKCLESVSEIEDDFCFGHSCSYWGYTRQNEFGDLKAYSIVQGCSNAIDMLNVYGKTNSCSLIGDSFVCLCGSEYCNKQQPYEVKIGNTKCYRFDSQKMYRSEYCYGDLCFRKKLHTALILVVQVLPTQKVWNICRNQEWKAILLTHIVYVMRTCVMENILLIEFLLKKKYLQTF